MTQNDRDGPPPARQNNNAAWAPVEVHGEAWIARLQHRHREIHEQLDAVQDDDAAAHALSTPMIFGLNLCASALTTSVTPRNHITEAVSTPVMNGVACCALSVAANAPSINVPSMMPAG